MADHHDGRRRQRRECVEVGPQYRGDLCEQHIAPPPMPVTIPSTVDITGLSPYERAFEAPVTANSASPPASNTCTAFDIRSMRGEK
jgi:hypothetical protein